MRNLASIIALTLTVFGCSREPDAGSELDQIFTDQRRATAEPADHPYILNMMNVCTAFVLDAEKRIGMTADHCGPELGGKLYWGSANLSDTTAPAVARITRMIETSLTGELDYVIFEFAFDGAAPSGMKSVKLAKTDQLAAALTKRTALALVGYPADKYQKRNLTRSDCRVRSSKIEEDRSMDSFSAQMIAAWKSRGLASHPEYAAMRAECYFISDRDGLSRPSFTTDCSVYGGNSGGPLLVSETGVVVGMPATYLPERPVQSGCYTKYWNTFFRPVTGQPMPTATASPRWDKLDRNDPTLADFPTAIPMHMIAQRSSFLQASPQYLADDALTKPSEPPLPSGDLFAALGRDDTLHVSAGAAVATLLVCKSDAASLCTDPDKVLATDAGPMVAGRRRVLTRAPLDPASAGTISIVAKDAAGRLVGARAVRFAPR